MRAYLERQIIFRRQRLAELERERARLLSELGAYEDALEQCGDDQIPGTNNPNDLSQYQSLNLSRAWSAILLRLAEFKHFNARDVALVANELLKEKTLKRSQSPGSIRAQLSLYTKKGLLTRRGGGQYRLVERTKIALQHAATNSTVQISLGQS